MILFVITDAMERYRKWNTTNARNKLEDQSGDACVVLHYTQVDLDVLARIQPWAVCHSGGAAPYEEYDVLEHEAYKRFVTEGNVPQLGICRGHQVVASFFGSEIGPIRRLKPDEPDVASSYQAGYFKEWGACPIEILEDDPLFEGLPRPPRLKEAHYIEVKKLADELKLLASSQACRVQAFRHRTKPVYGVQFHPETANEDYPDGDTVLKNFFRFAREWK